MMRTADLSLSGIRFSVGDDTVALYAVSEKRIKNREEVMANS